MGNCNVGKTKTVPSTYYKNREYTYINNENEVVIFGPVYIESGTTLYSQSRGMRRGTMWLIMLVAPEDAACTSVICPIDIPTVAFP